MDFTGKARQLPGGILLTAWLALAPGLPALGQSPAPSADPQGTYLTLSKSDCDRLARHHPAEDVTYQPGRDVRGKAVAPADLDGGNGLVLPEAVVIPIEVDMFDRFGIPANDANFKGDVFIGEVVVDVASGRATFNGQPLQNDAEAELAALCQRIIRDGARAR